MRISKWTHWELVHWRILALILITWFPLLIVSAVGTGIGDIIQISCFHDIEVHVQFLVALAIVIGAELLAMTTYVRWYDALTVGSRFVRR